ncbi:uncharacterized protein [Argopecten irradians]|uniref:uncharacterized protein n=1 Tax=Argopecten irradians TaxID=31199 RepID=UPI00370FE147
MALLLLKTTDPSWQDRTVNVEVMLAPARNQLLMNKHKTLESKCLMAHRLYEKERQSMLKDILIEKRIMERKKQALLRKKSDIMLNRVSSGATYSKQNNTSVSKTSSTKRGGSAPAKLGWASKNPNKAGVFLTEVSGEPRSQSVTTTEVSGESRSHSVAITEKDKYWGVSPSPSHGNTSMQVAGSASQLSASSRRVISPFGQKRSSRRIKSVRFDDNRILETQQTDSVHQPSVDGLVEQFVKAQVEFNTRPVIGSADQNKTTRPGTNTPIVAKRYSSLSVNNEKLINAFDNFCLDRNKDDFQKLVRFASKLKSSAKLARNQSVVPAVAALRSSKKFVDQVRKPETPEI